MKYLKKFEDLDVSENRSKEEIQSHLDEIKSVFQEYIDDFDIEELPADLEEDDDSVSGLFYHLYWYATDKRRGKLLFQFDFYIYDNENRDFRYKFIEFLKFKDEIKKSLTSRGYGVVYHSDFKTMDDDYPQSDWSFKLDWTQ